MWQKKKNNNYCKRFKHQKNQSVLWNLKDVQKEWWLPVSLEGCEERERKKKKKEAWKGELKNNSAEEQKSYQIETKHL